MFDFLDAFSNIINLFSICGWYIKIQLLYIDLVSRAIGKLNSNDLPIGSTRSSYIQITLSMSSKFYFFPIHMIFVSLALMYGHSCYILDLNGKAVKISAGNSAKAFYSYS